MHVQYIWPIIREWMETIGIRTTVTGRSQGLPVRDGNKKSPNDCTAEVSLGKAMKMCTGDLFIELLG